MGIELGASVSIISEDNVFLEMASDVASMGPFKRLNGNDVTEVKKS